jgi:hypothetical protein
MTTSNATLELVLQAKLDHSLALVRHAENLIRLTMAEQAVDRLEAIEAVSQQVFKTADTACLIGDKETLKLNLALRSAVEFLGAVEPK